MWFSSCDTGQMALDISRCVPVDDLVPARLQLGWYHLLTSEMSV